MISASLSLSLPRLGWKSTSMPRSLKICTAAGDSASEMRTLGFVIWAPSPSPGGGGPGGGGGGEWVDVKFCVRRVCGEIPPPRRTLRRVDPPPPGEGEDQAAL